MRINGDTLVTFLSNRTRTEGLEIAVSGRMDGKML
jgi:hypothetical protein